MNQVTGALAVLLVLLVLLSHPGIRLPRHPAIGDDGLVTCVAFIRATQVRGRAGVP